MCALHKQRRCGRPEGTAASQAGPVPPLIGTVSLSPPVLIFSFFFFPGADGGTLSFTQLGKCSSAKLHHGLSFLSQLTALARPLLPSPKLFCRHQLSLWAPEHLSALKLFLVLKPPMVATSPLGLSSDTELCTKPIPVCSRL